MARFMSCSLALVGLAGGAAVALAYRISRDTGKDFPEAFKDIPAEVRRMVAELRERALQAVSSGRTAAAQKEQEIAAVLARGPRNQAQGDFSSS